MLVISFFDCVVAMQLWCCVSEILGINLDIDFLSIGQMWLSNRKFVVEYVFCAATQWGLWKLRNNLCIQGSQWKNEQSLLTMILGMLQRWTTLSPAEKRVEYHIYHVVDTESFGHKTAKDQLKQVKDRGDECLFNMGTWRWTGLLVLQLKQKISWWISCRWRMFCSRGSGLAS